MARTLAEEADYCRQLVGEVGSLAEQVMLNSIAREFDRLANAALVADRPHYAARAAQELTAAAAARHPRARSAHITMAGYYGALAR
ncbi:MULTISPECIES: hypothetical protein [Sphingomonas]|uniref:hypothetical protein n=1 Tax=Sphingomonas TaxID=13687 RepID=UPI00126A57FC|nr:MULTISPECIES: hypothetical protein [Sphingomonas]